MLRTCDLKPKELPKSEIVTHVIEYRREQEYSVEFFHTCVPLRWDE